MALSAPARARLQATSAKVGTLVLWWRVGGIIPSMISGAVGSLALMAWVSPPHSAPIQRALDRALHAVLAAFSARTGCPVLVNTSFNVRGEPPVGHPREALEGFFATEMDALALGPFFIEKRLLPPELRRSAAPRAFAPD